MKRLAVVLMAVMLVLAMTGVAQASVTVKVGANGANKFSPASKSISKGTKVVWKDVNGSHTVTAYGGNWSKNASLDNGESTSFTFKKTGTFKYRCTIHSSLSGGSCSGMCGKITVN